MEIRAFTRKRLVRKSRSVSFFSFVWEFHIVDALHVFSFSRFLLIKTRLYPQEPVKGNHF